MILILLIVNHDWNINASIVFGLISFIAILISAKEFIQIDSSEIAIVTKRFFPSLTKTKVYKKNEISNIEYNPKRTNYLILITPNVGGSTTSANFKITLTSGKTFIHFTDMKKQEIENLRNILNIKQ
ncbi:MAG: hypothetical protein CVU00_11835 [Bacteroidetes bacterium HGW-Bacteroidetes-17]|nr:MAG: hypothetical protein CVU00_11835 [Bacteroidetes bacterium HGW-Bacteroidetes-17]